MINPKKIVIFVVGVVFLLVVGIIATDSQSKKTESTKTSEPESDVYYAPDFTLSDLNGNLVKLSDYKDKIVIINFWATWCAPCREEIPGFIELQKKYKDDLVILGISVDQGGPQIVPPFVERYGINYLILYADGDVIRNYGGIRGVPTTFVLDRNQVIQRYYPQYMPVYVFDRDIQSFM